MEHLKRTCEFSGRLSCDSRDDGRNHSAQSVICRADELTIVFSICRVSRSQTSVKLKSTWRQATITLGENEHYAIRNALFPTNVIFRHSCSTFSNFLSCFGQAFFLLLRELYCYRAPAVSICNQWMSAVFFSGVLPSFFSARLGKRNIRT